MPHPTLVLNRPYSTLAGSVAGDQALRLSHNHPLFRDDNEQFYGILEEAVRGKLYEATINTFQRLADVRGSYLALIAQHAGRDKWISMMRTAKEYVNNRKWDRTTATTMQAHIKRCRESYFDWETASLHVPDQVPIERTTVQSLLDSMDGCNYPKVCARLAVISNESLGMLNSFEYAVAHLLPALPVAAKVFKKSKGAQISGIGGSLKVGTGPKTGVELRYNKPTEYKNLSMEEKYEIRGLLPESKSSKGYNKNKKGNSDGKNRGKGQRQKNPWKKKIKGKVAALKKQHKKDMEEMTELATVISGAKQAPPEPVDAAASSVARLNAILKKHRDSK